MVTCQWHFDVPYGKQGDALKVMRAWAADNVASSEFRRARHARLLAGYVGVSASHIIQEYEFDSLADFDAALDGMKQPQFQKHSDALAPYIVPGTQHWCIYRSMDAAGA